MERKIQKYKQAVENLDISEALVLRSLVRSAINDWVQEQEARGISLQMTSTIRHQMLMIGNDILWDLPYHVVVEFKEDGEIYITVEED